MVMQIKKLREDRGIPQKQLAAEMGVLPSAVSNWESELCLPKARQLPLLAHILECSISDLFSPEALLIS